MADVLPTETATPDPSVNTEIQVLSDTPPAQDGTGATTTNLLFSVELADQTVIMASARTGETVHDAWIRVGTMLRDLYANNRSVYDKFRANDVYVGPLNDLYRDIEMIAKAGGPT